MARKKKNKDIRKPRGGVNPPESGKIYQEFEELPKVDKRKTLKEWFDSARNFTLEDDGKTNSAIIDPKQAAYAKKRRKK